MSTIFNYSRMKDTVNKSGMLPGQKSRVTPVDVIRSKASSVTADIYDGMLVKLVVDANGVERVEPITSSTDKVFGVVVQDLRGSREAVTFGTPQYITKYIPGSTVSVMLKGYIYVPVHTAGAIIAGDKVYMLTTTSGKAPVGAIVTEAGSTVTVDGQETEIAEEINAVFTGNYGYPLSSTQDGSTSSALTAKTAEIAVDFDLR